MAFKRSGVRFPSPPWLGNETRTVVCFAGIAQLVEHNLAKVGVAGSSPVSRSPKPACRSRHIDAGWSSLVARRAHNPEVVGSNPTPAISERGTRNAEQAPQDSLFRVTPSAFRV